MNKESTTFGLSPEKLGRLLSIGSEIGQSEKQADKTEERVDLLHDRLAETLPLDQSMLRFLPTFLAHLCERVGVLAGEAIGALLQNKKTDIYLTRKIKDYSKDLSEFAKTEAENDTAIAIYYAAIAHALVFHDVKITRFSYESLNNAFCSLIEKTWMCGELRVVFDRAVEICQEKCVARKSPPSV